MKPEPELNPPEYDPNLLLDALQQRFKLKNDAALADFLQINRAVISRLRRRKSQITAALMVCLHEATNMSLSELRSMMGDTRPYCLLSSKTPFLSGILNSGD